MSQLWGGKKILTATIRGQIKKNWKWRALPRLPRRRRDIGEKRRVTQSIERNSELFKKKTLGKQKGEKSQNSKRGGGNR